MFRCDKCGLCCRHIGSVAELAEFDAGGGVCVHLTADNLCSIYPDRPDICNVDKMYELKFKKIMGRDRYDELNALGCKTLKDACESERQKATLTSVVR